MTETLFAQTSLQAGVDASFLRNFSHNVIYKRIEKIAVDQSESVDINVGNFANPENEWNFIVAQVEGEAFIGYYDGVAPTNRPYVAYGTRDHPGIIMISRMAVFTSANDEYKLYGLADGTKVTLLYCVVCEDDDARLPSNQ